MIPMACLLSPGAAFRKSLFPAALLAALISVSTGSSGHGETPVRICYAENQAIHWVARYVTRHLYTEAEIPFTFHGSPMKRTLMEMQEGKCEAEVGRIRAALSSRPFITALEIPTVSVPAYIFSPVDNVNAAATWNDLENRVVGAVRGELYVERNTKDIDGIQVVWVSGYKQLFNLLARGRIDAAVGLSIGLRDVSEESRRLIVRSDDQVASITIYHLMHEDLDRKIVAGLEAAIERLNRTGRLSSIQQTALGEVLTVGTLQ